MSLHRAFDAAFPPPEAYPGSAGVMGYIGGNTPHIWTPAEWQRFAALAQWPIWVGEGEADPVTHGRTAADRARVLGWSPDAPGGNRRGIVLDYETQIDPAWIDAFAAVVWDAGYETFVYGSQSTVVDNPPKEGRWIALYNGLATIPDDAHAIAHQFLANVPYLGTTIDLSVVTDTMLAHAGTGPRHG